MLALWIVLAVVVVTLVVGLVVVVPRRRRAPERRSGSAGAAAATITKPPAAPVGAPGRQRPAPDPAPHRPKSRPSKPELEVEVEADVGAGPRAPGAHGQDARPVLGIRAGAAEPFVGRRRGLGRPRGGVAARRCGRGHHHRPARGPARPVSTPVSCAAPTPSWPRSARICAARSTPPYGTGLSFDTARARCVWLFVGRERGRQDHHHRQGGPAPEGGGPFGAARRGGHLPGRGGRAARPVGATHRRRDRAGRRRR